jgi:hypothetical protein
MKEKIFDLQERFIDYSVRIIKVVVIFTFCI